MCNVKLDEACLVNRYGQTIEAVLHKELFFLSLSNLFSLFRHLRVENGNALNVWAFAIAHFVDERRVLHPQEYPHEAIYDLAPPFLLS
jgi:hypothetical protein